MGIVLSQGIICLAVENIDFSTAGGNGTGTSAIGGDLSPLIKSWRVIQGNRESRWERRWDAEGAILLLIIECITATGTDAVHIAVAVEGDTMMIVGLRAFIEPRPGEAFNTGLIVIDLSLNIGEAMGFLLCGFQRGR